MSWKGEGLWRFLYHGEEAVFSRHLRREVGPGAGRGKEGPAEASGTPDISLPGPAICREGPRDPSDGLSSMGP